MVCLNTVPIFNWFSISLVFAGLGIMFAVMRMLFFKSVLYKIGVSTGTVIVLATFISGAQAKLGPIHNAWSFPLLVALSVLAYLYIVYVIKRPLRKIISSLKVLSEGKLNLDIEEKVKEQDDEIGEIARAITQMQSGLKEKANFSRKIGSGSFDDSFALLSENDELGEALIQMQNSLKHAQEEERKRKEEDTVRNWVTEGQAKFADILRQNNSDIPSLSYSIVSHIVSYMQINQAGLFILDEDSNEEKLLILEACYAYDRQKFMQKSIKIGEGLVGTCFLEKQRIYMQQIPESYLKISSGLGDERPASLLLVPLKLNEEVFGVLEMASFEAFEAQKIEFAERIGEIIASTISALKINNRTSELLEKSQQQAEEMRAQEEEMRQNMEELSATQEAMAEKERNNQEKISNLEKENQTLVNEVSSLKKKLNL